MSNNNEQVGPRHVAEHLNKLTAQQRQVVELSAQITEESPEEIAYQHVVLCHLGFPRSRTASPTFERMSGNASLRLEAGALSNGFEWVPQALPYGSIPRVIMIAAITHAVKNKTPVVELGRSMSESLRRLGLSETGAQHWRNVVKQSQAMAAMTMRLAWRTGEEVKQFQGTPVREISAWAHRNPEQLTLMPSVITFSLDFYQSLERASVPLDPRAVSSVVRYPLALDIYCWLAHRLYRVRDPRGDFISWPALKGQFGSEIADPRNFKRLFQMALKRVLLQYPAATVKPRIGGIVLHTSAPPIASASSVVALKVRGRK